MLGIKGDKSMNEIELLTKISDFITQINSSNKRSDKEKVLLELATPEIKQLLKLTFDYDIQYYVTSKNIEKLKNTLGYELSKLSLFELLDQLRTRSITGHAAIKAVNSYVQTYPQFKDVIYKIIDRDLGIGIATKTINEILPGLIKIFDVALAQDLRKKPKIKLDDTWVIERKLDGCRTILIYKNKDDIHLYSRTGLEYTTLNKVIEEVTKLNLPDNTVIDGETCLVNDKDQEDFQGIMKEIKRKDHTIQNPKYIVFDMMPLDVFEGKIVGDTYKIRVQNLIDICDKVDNLKIITPIEYVEYNPDNLAFMKKCVVDSNWEGLMFRRDVPYEGKRTDNLLKNKSFFDAEYVVKGVEEGDITEVINNKANKIKVVGSLLIEHKGYEVKVGSGLSLDQRKTWFQNPNEIIGKTITVAYFEETTDQNGNKSLRFPTLKAIHGDKREI